MATLTLPLTFINLAADGTLVLAAWSTVEGGMSHAHQGEVTTAAGGRRRAVSVEGEATVWPFGLRYVTLAQVASLRDYADQVVQVRDIRGQLHYGKYFQVEQTNIREVGRYDVSMELNVVTFPEGV
jgi:hypothetical protein